MKTMIFICSDYKTIIWTVWYISGRWYL